LISGRHVILYYIQAGSKADSAPPPMEGLPKVLCPGVKRPDYESDHSSLSNSEVDMLSFTSAPTIRLHGVAFRYRVIISL
jgi:hypothetical protein